MLRRGGKFFFSNEQYSPKNLPTKLKMLLLSKKRLAFNEECVGPKKADLLCEQGKWATLARVKEISKLRLLFNDSPQ